MNSEITMLTREIEKLAKTMRGSTDMVFLKMGVSVLKHRADEIDHVLNRVKAAQERLNRNFIPCE